MSGPPLEGRRVLVTRTRERATGLVDRLHALGASVEIVPLLTTVPLATPDEIAAAAATLREAGRRLRAALTTGVDAITLTSGSTARHLAEALAGHRLESRVAIICIGRQTAAAARQAGLRVDGVAADPSADGIAAVLAA